MYVINNIIIRVKYAIHRMYKNAFDFLVVYASISLERFLKYVKSNGLKNYKTRFRVQTPRRTAVTEIESTAQRVEKNPCIR